MDPQKTLFRPQRYLQSSVTSALQQDLRLPTETLKNSSSHQLPTAARGAELTLLLLLSGGSLLAPPRTCSTALMEAEEGDPLVFSHWCIANCSRICIHYDMSHCTVKSAFKWDLKTDGIKTSLTFIKICTTDRSTVVFVACFVCVSYIWPEQYHVVLTATYFHNLGVLTRLLEASCSNGEAISASVSPPVPRFEPRRHSQAHRWSDFRYTGRGSDQFSFTVWWHKVFPDIWRHLSQQGRTVQSDLAPRIPMTWWLIQGPLQVFYFWDTNGAKQWCQMMSAKDESGLKYRLKLLQLHTLSLQLPLKCNKKLFFKKETPFNGFLFFSYLQESREMNDWFKRKWNMLQVLFLSAALSNTWFQKYNLPLYVRRQMSCEPLHTSGCRKRCCCFFHFFFRKDTDKGCHQSFGIPRECTRTVGPVDKSNDFVIPITGRAVRQLRKTASG